MHILVNCTSHQQDTSTWLEEARDAVMFVDGGAPIVDVPIEPDKALHPQVMKNWINVLETIDAAYARNEAVSGVMVAGYAPLCIGIAKQCRDFRQKIFVSVMKRIDPKPEWAKSPFVPASVRWVQPAPFARNAKKRPSRRDGGKDKVIHISPRPLTEERKALIEGLGCKIAASPMILPPVPNGDPFGESTALRSAVENATKLGSSFILDGAPVETALHVWNVCIEYGVPLYYLATVPAPPPLFAQPVSIEVMPY